MSMKTSFTNSANTQIENLPALSYQKAGPLISESLQRFLVTQSQIITDFSQKKPCSSPYFKNPQWKKVYKGFKLLTEYPELKEKVFIAWQIVNVTGLNALLIEEIRNINQASSRINFNKQESKQSENKKYYVQLSSHITDEDKTLQLPTVSSNNSVQELVSKLRFEVMSLQQQILAIQQKVNLLENSSEYKTQIFLEIKHQINQKIKSLNISDLLNPTDMVDKNQIMEIFNISESTYYRHRDNWTCYKVGAKSMYNLAEIKTQSLRFLK
jgi:hypothetical protein